MKFAKLMSISIGLILLLSACGPAPDATPAVMLLSQTPTSEPSATLAPTATPTQTATLTPTDAAAKIPTPTDAPAPTATPLVCDSYFDSVNPAIVVQNPESPGYKGADEVGGVRSILLLKDDRCPLESFRAKTLNVFANGVEIVSGINAAVELGSDGIIRLDFTDYAFPETEELEIEVTDNEGNTVYSGEVLNIAQTGIFRVPGFVNAETGISNPKVLNAHEIRVYHVDSIVLPDGSITSSFEIGDVVDVEDQCGKPDGIHPEWIHGNAIDFGRCEHGPESTHYEIYYNGPYPMTVRDVDFTDLGIILRLDFAFERIPNPPLLVSEEKGGSLSKYYLVLQYGHLTDVFVSEGDFAVPGTRVGLIGKSRFSTELEEARALTREKSGQTLEPGAGTVPFIPFKLTLSVAEGDWLESLINEYNNPALASGPQYDIEVKVFHDRSGNGIKDAAEPPVSGVSINASGASCITDSQGACTLRLTAGESRLAVEPSQSSLPSARAIFHGQEVLGITQKPGVTVKENEVIHLGLGQGPLPSLPMKAESFGYLIKGFGDLNADGSPHWALDFIVVGDGPQVIYANVSGEVEKVPDSTPEQPFGRANLVNIMARGPVWNFNVGLGHLTKVYVQPGQYVEKGTPVGEIDPTLYLGDNEVGGTLQPHLEYYVFGPGGVGTDGDWGMLDPLTLAPKTGELVPME